ncbi:MAG: phosphatidate cytidylyltransferase [Acidimicrobiales bacterium]
MDNDPNDSESESSSVFGDEDHGLPHWTEPGTGEVPKLAAEGDDDLSAWSSLTNSGPRWADDPGGGDEVPPTSQPAAQPTAQPTPPVAIGGGGQVEDDFFTYDTAPASRRQRSAEGPAPAAPVGSPQGGNSGGGSADLMPRVATGAILAGVAVLCLVIGKPVTLLLIAAVLGLAASEFFVSLRRVGYQPATLLGLTATISLPLGVYWRGEEAIGVVLVITIIFGALWYLVGVSSERPVPNLGVTVLGVVYIGVLGSYAAVLLDSPDGIGLVLTAIVLAVGYDIGGYVIGRTFGRSPLSDASPNKTVEGLLGGMITTVLVGLVVVGIIGIDPFSGDPFGTVDAVLVAVAVAVVAPIGDLAESLMKRDLGLKDMGTILPGHGGVLDRFDALLFVFPTVYFMVLLLAS